MTSDCQEQQAETGFHRKALAFNNETLSYIARGAPLDHLLDRIARGFSQAYPGRSLGIFLFDAAQRRLRIGAAPGMLPDHLRQIEALDVREPDTPQFWQRFQDSAVEHCVEILEMLPLRSFAGEVAGILVVCGQSGAPADPRYDEMPYRQTVGAAVSMAMLSIERSMAPAHIRPPIESAGPGDERMALAIEGSGTGIWDRNAVTGEIYYSRGWKAILGYEDWELSNHIEDAYKRVHPEDLPYVKETIQRHFAAQSDTYVVEHRILCRDNSYKWICSRGKVVARDAQGNALRMIGTTTDITELKQLTEKLRKSGQLLADLTNEIPGMAFQYRIPPGKAGYFTYVSEGVREIYGFTPEQLLADAAMVEAILHPEDLPVYQSSLRAIAGGAGHWRLEYRVTPPGAGQGVRWLRGHAKPRWLADGSMLWHGFISDVSESKAIELELQEFALTDFLTQVPNRRYFMKRLEEEHGRIQRSSDGRAALLMCDLDHFKAVNDTYGHAVGDQVLKNFADVLKAQLRKSDTVGRFGGEEFAVILADADAQVAAVFAERLQRSFAAQPLVVGGQTILVTLSIGIAIILPDCECPETALRQSDEALYRAKESGRNRFEIAPVQERD
ncbi:sensor domain-containing diguanylate cyclase [Herbaspirillum sp.]|uniref:sensor domain-containing diguanylate cyclase n=1 Tax=Herbaspirillum sp. TaxID=1890675 RepID=UPI001B0819B7|nr:sensor domain-containing diguanylate cyclase [Herbaspirillum sp.]MBO9535094.1 diguanylate cyclase [Herbaspirillum sp.]